MAGKIDWMLRHKKTAVDALVTLTQSEQMGACQHDILLVEIF